MERLKEKTVLMPFSVSVIIAAFNECESLENVVNEASSELIHSHFYRYEIIIIDDGSTDGTEKIVDGLEHKYPHVRVIHHNGNKGLGIVYKTGFDHARHDFITFYPADGQYPASNICRFIPMMNDFDLILGYLPIKKSSIYANFLSNAEKILFRLAFGKLPKFQGIFMLRKKVLNEIRLKSHGRAWTIVMELIIRMSRGNYRIVSIPIDMHPRLGGKSKVNNLKTILYSVKQLLILYMYL